MTDNEIIKALEWHLNDETHCSPCPYEEQSVTHYCVDMVIQDALSLINRQNAEIERLNKDYVDMRIKYGFVKCSSELIKAEAIKEFAERLKGNFAGGWLEVDEDWFEKFVKEIVGEDNGSL